MRFSISPRADWLCREAGWLGRSRPSPCWAFSISSSSSSGAGSHRDHRPDRLQIVYGLLCNREGCPVAIEVFEGNTADPMTLSNQVQKLKLRFGLDHVVVVGDRGMITSARIGEDLEPAGLDWITALRASSIQELANGGPAAIVAVRRSRPGRDHLARLSPASG